MEFEGYLSKIEERLFKHFDLERNKEIQGYEFDLFAKYKVTNQRTFLTKKDVVSGKI